MTCKHVWTLYNSAGRQYVACLLCGAIKPPEPCYFSEQGDAARKRLEGNE